MSDVIDKAARLLEDDQYASMFELMASEIERLRERNKEHEDRYAALEALGVRHDRNSAIEECAMVVLNFEVGDSPHKIKLCEQLAAAIRALKSHD